MLLGDIHNNRQVLHAALRTAADEGRDVLVQVGDFWLQDRNWRTFSPESAGVMLCAQRVSDQRKSRSAINGIRVA